MIMETLNKRVQELFNNQLVDWPEMGGRYADLVNVQTRQVFANGCAYRLQYNPGRLKSSSAKVDKKSVSARPCFLCERNRPKEQEFFLVGHDCEEVSLCTHTYEVLINPFPIFPCHLTIVDQLHVPQLIGDRIYDLLYLSRELNEFTFFYNGPQAGASAPDHAHFQAGNRNFLPIERMIFSLERCVVTEQAGACLYTLKGDLMHTMIVEGNNVDAVASLYKLLLDLLPLPDGASEPLLNVLSWYEDGVWRLCLIPRSRHRPKCYSATGADQHLVSPASVDMGGVFILPRLEDFDTLSGEDISRILSDVCMQEDEVNEVSRRLHNSLAVPDKTVDVGILCSDIVAVTFDEGIYRRDVEMTGSKDNASEELSAVSGNQLFKIEENQICWNGQRYTELFFKASDCYTDSFEVKEVAIGIAFHWERKENQRFRGDVKLVVENGAIRLINRVPIELYLESVISSEMSANASQALLQAHAVISRSWLLAQMYPEKVFCAERTSPNDEAASTDSTESASTDSSGKRIIKWYDKQEHIGFDVCADDHCQRYQGIRVTTSAAHHAVAYTRGEVLKYQGALCDTRFSKCCGGMLEEFDNCWGEEKHPYLKGKLDLLDRESAPLIDEVGDLKDEQQARKWILSSPAVNCNTQDRNILEQVLNGYDQETTHFFRWEVRYSQETLTELFARRSGLDIGVITNLIARKRGTSGRIVELDVCGSKARVIVGKELEIRRLLSESHLQSSAFVIDMDGTDFILRGAGWGHGVGLCQIGAAVLGAKGFRYEEILTHYYPETERALYE